MTVIMRLKIPNNFLNKYIMETAILKAHFTYIGIQDVLTKIQDYVNNYYKQQYYNQFKNKDIIKWILSSSMECSFCGEFNSIDYPLIAFYTKKLEKAILKNRYVNPKYVAFMCEKLLDDNECTEYMFDNEGNLFCNEEYEDWFIFNNKQWKQIKNNI